MKTKLILLLAMSALAINAAELIQPKTAGAPMPPVVYELTEAQALSILNSLPLKMDADTGSKLLALNVIRQGNKFVLSMNLNYKAPAKPVKK